MPKRVSDEVIEEIVDSFLNGVNIQEISIKYDLSPTTISKKLKLNLTQKKINEIKNIHQDKNLLKEQNVISHSELPSVSYEESFFDQSLYKAELRSIEKQKDLSSAPIKDVKLPKIVYMLEDKKIELIPKFLRDYPEWDFLPEEDLNRKTIEIFTDLKEAKRRCKREEKVIKVPNPNVFNIVAPILISKGISRLISDDKLISL